MPLVLLVDSEPAAEATCLRLGAGILSLDRARERWGPLFTEAVREVLGPGPAAAMLSSVAPWPAIDDLLVMMSVARLPASADSDVFVDCGHDGARILGVPATAALVTGALSEPGWALTRRAAGSGSEETPLQEFDAAVRETVIALAGTRVRMAGALAGFPASDDDWLQIAELTLLGYRVDGIEREPDAGRIVAGDRGCTWILPMAGAAGREVQVGAVLRDGVECAIAIRTPGWRRVVAYPAGLTAQRLVDAEVHPLSLRAHFTVDERSSDERASDERAPDERTPTKAEQGA